MIYQRHLGLPPFRYIDFLDKVCFHNDKFYCHLVSLIIHMTRKVVNGFLKIFFGNLWYNVGKNVCKYDKYKV